MLSFSVPIAMGLAELSAAGPAQLAKEVAYTGLYLMRRCYRRYRCEPGSKTIKSEVQFVQTLASLYTHHQLWVRGRCASMTYLLHKPKAHSGRQSAIVQSATTV